MNTPKNIVVIGAGELGGAIGKVLKGANVGAIQYWDNNPARVVGQKSMAEIIPDADFVFLCVPSWSMKDAVRDVARYVTPKTTIICLAKGLEEENAKTMDEILKELLPEAQNFALLSGPMLAEELSQGKSGFGMVACEDRKIFTHIKHLFNKTEIFLEYSKDVKGIALSGALKNVYAVGFGIVDGLGWSSNAKGWLVAKASEEMYRILDLLGVHKKEVLESSGIGDLVTTGYSSYSRNRQIGDEIVKTGQCCLKGEGSNSIVPFTNLLGDKAVEFPVFNSLVKIMIRKENAKVVFDQLLRMLK